MTYLVADLRRLPPLDLGRFDLVVLRERTSARALIAYQRPGTAAGLPTAQLEILVLNVNDHATHREVQARLGGKPGDPGWTSLPGLLQLP